MVYQTTDDKNAQISISRMLTKEGYKPYADLLDNFRVLLTSRPDVIAYTDSARGTVVINKKLKPKFISTVVRHELLHNHMQHMRRELEFNDKNNLVIDPTIHDLANRAQDFEISNQGYTEEDKQLARKIQVGAETFCGLVTEDDYPEWFEKNYTFEQMYDELLKKLKDEKQKAKQDMQNDKSDSESDDDPSDSNSDSNSDNNPSNNNSDDSQKQKKQVQLGDRGNPDEEAAEEKEREVLAQAQGQPGESDEETKERIKKLQKILQDPEISKRLKQVIQDKIESELEQQARDRHNAVSKDQLRKFELSLYQFITSEVSKNQERSYKKLKPGYEEQDLFVPSMTYADHEIPVLNAYIDRSGSFSIEKILPTVKALNVLDSYVKRGDIELNIKYFTTELHDSPEESGGTDINVVLADIEKTRPDNIIIMTDSDSENANIQVKVPGAAYILFVESQAPNLVSHIKSTNKHVYDITGSITKKIEQ